MSYAPDPDVPCAAGRTAFFGGRWATPCMVPPIHVIGFNNPEHPDEPVEHGPLHLCNEHFGQVFEAGLIAEPMLPEKEFQRRENERATRVRRDGQRARRRSR